MTTLYGWGPPPPGFFRCWLASCRARRDPCTGRWLRSGAHYHPVKP